MVTPETLPSASRTKLSRSGDPTSENWSLPSAFSSTRALRSPSIVSVPPLRLIAETASGSSAEWYCPTYSASVGACCQPHAKTLEQSETLRMLKRQILEIVTQYLDRSNHITIPSPQTGPPPSDCDGGSCHTQIEFAVVLALRYRLDRYRAGIALPILATMGPVAERAVRRHPAAAQRDRRLPRQIPRIAVHIDQRNWTFDPKRPIGTNCNLDCFL